MMTHNAVRVLPRCACVPIHSRMRARDFEIAIDAGCVRRMVALNRACLVAWARPILSPIPLPAKAGSKLRYV
jgi:hypothetical protein